MQTKTFSYNGKRIFYRTKGSGSLVVLLHGFGEDGAVWQNQFDTFPANQLIIPDLPGSGESESIEDMSMEGLAEAVKGLLEAESTAGSFKCIMIGHSMGGYITLSFAEKYPEALAAFGLFQSTAFADSNEKKETRRKGIAAIKEGGAEAFLKTFVSNLYAPVTKAERPQRIDEHLTGVRNFSAAVLVTYFEAMMTRPDRTAVLRESGVPVLFVMSEHDKAVPLDDGLKQCHLPQLSYIHLLQNSGHMGMVEEPEEANKILIAFMNTVDNLAQS